MKIFDKIKKRFIKITGLFTPIGGVSWVPPEDKEKIEDEDREKRLEYVVETYVQNRESGTTTHLHGMIKARVVDKLHTDSEIREACTRIETIVGHNPIPKANREPLEKLDLHRFFTLIKPEMLSGVYNGGTPEKAIETMLTEVDTKGVQQGTAH